MSRPPLGSSFTVFGLTIPWYSLLIMIAFVIGIALAMREEKRLKLPKDTALNFALLAIPLGLIGARLFYVAFTWNRFAADPLEILRVWNGGLAIYGGILGGILAAYLVTRKHKENFLTLLDACAPSLALGQAIGRWGNYANMEAYGERIYDQAAQFFPIAVEISLVNSEGVEYVYWHMATFFYESVWCFVIFLILMACRKRMGRRGDVLYWYILLYGAGRTVIEGLRDDSLMLNVAAAQVRVSQVLSAVGCLVIVVIFFVRLVRSQKIHFADYLSWPIILLGIGCTFVGEFERNAYQMLFIAAQALLGALLALDVVFFAHYLHRARRLDGPAIWMIAAIVLCAGTLLLGIGRMGGSNVAYIALRQVVAMMHVVLCAGWFYLRCGPPYYAEHAAQAQESEMREEANATA